MANSCERMSEELRDKFAFFLLTKVRIGEKFFDPQNIPRYKKAFQRIVRLWKKQIWDDPSSFAETERQIKRNLIGLPSREKNFLSDFFHEIKVAIAREMFFSERA